MARKKRRFAIKDLLEDLDSFSPPLSKKIVLNWYRLVSSSTFAWITFIKFLATCAMPPPCLTEFTPNKILLGGRLMGLIAKADHIADLVFLTVPLYHIF